MRYQRIIFATIALSTLTLGRSAIAQRFRGFDESSEPRWGVPTWEIDERFKQDTFTFARVQYSSQSDALGYPFGGGGRRDRGRRGLGRGGGGGEFGRSSGPPDYIGTYGGGWGTDGPQSDLDFSFRLHQLTSFKVNPNPVVKRLTDEDLFDYPFLYMIETYSGDLYFTDAEIVALRRYLLNGGFLMVDDFWGAAAYQHFHEQIKRVFPDQEPEELDISHEIFHCVYNIKEKPQVPSIGRAQQGRAWGITYEDHGPGSETVHYKAIFDKRKGLDDDKRIMVLICHNTDLGDGWEREGNDEWYFHNFAENKSYPMGINIVTYAMTH